MYPFKFEGIKIKKMSAKRNMPNKIEVLKYWVDRLVGQKYWLDAFYDAETMYEKKQVTNICFACGGFFGTQRCHIIPKYISGDDTANNLHLLCPECHLESESLFDKESYFSWFSSKNPTNSGSYRRMFILTKQHFETLKLNA